MKAHKPSPINRRHLLGGAGTAGALAAAAALLPGRAPEPEAAAPSATTPEPKAGYQLSDHVLRYYQTAKI